MTELKPCPFCGGKAQLFCGEEGVAVICTREKCRCRTDWYKDYSAVYGMDRWRSGTTVVDHVIEVWNRRKEDD